jgi:hypothetical protein
MAFMKRKYKMKPWKRKTTRFSPNALKKATYKKNAKRKFKLKKVKFNLKYILLSLLLILIVFYLL